MNPHLRACVALVLRDVRSAARRPGDVATPLFFFVVVSALFPLAIGPAPETLGRIAPGIVWVCALLAALLPLDRLFGADAEDGTLDQLLLSGLGPSAVTAGARRPRGLGGESAGSATAGGGGMRLGGAGPA